MVIGGSHSAFCVGQLALDDIGGPSVLVSEGAEHPAEPVRDDLILSVAEAPKGDKFRHVAHGAGEVSDSREEVGRAARDGMELFEDLQGLP